MRTASPTASRAVCCGPCAARIFPDSPAASGMMSAAVAAMMKSAVYQPRPAINVPP
jgi:hypothetical protein